MSAAAFCACSAQGRQKVGSNSRRRCVIGRSRAGGFPRPFGRGKTIRGGGGKGGGTSVFLVARRSAWRPGRGGCRGNELAAFRLPRLEVQQRGGAASEKDPRQPGLGDSPADLRATYPPPLLVGGVYGGREGRSMWWSEGDIPFAPRGSRQPSCEPRCQRCCGRERHCSCRLSALPCVRERSRAFPLR